MHNYVTIKLLISMVITLNMDHFFVVKSFKILSYDLFQICIASCLALVTLLCN